MDVEQRGPQRPPETSGGELRRIGLAEWRLGALARLEGDPDGALLRFRAAIRALRKAGDDESLAWVLNDMGRLLNELRLPVRAQEHLEEGLAIARARSDRRVEGALLGNQADALIALGRHAEAEQALSHSMSIAREAGDATRAAEVCRAMGVLERERGRFAAAARHLTEALALARSVESPLLVAEILREWGDLRACEGDVAAAVRDWAEALTGFEKLQAQLDVERLRARLRAAESGPPASDGGK